MPYSRNFGFRGFENIVRHGRHKTPAAGPALVLGAPVVAAAGGVLAAASGGAEPTGLSGVLVYEHIQFQGVDTNLTTPTDPPFDVAPLGRFAQIVHGPGVKLWFANTSDKTLYDGRVQTGRTMVNLTGVVVGDVLVPNETPATALFRKRAATDTVDDDGAGAAGTRTKNGWFAVENVDVARGRVEVRFLF